MPEPAGPIAPTARGPGASPHVEENVQRAIHTGGKVVDPKPTGPGEIRGASIEGGETRVLKPGDVVVVPHGVPHWFREVQGPLTYYVVKVP